MFITIVNTCYRMGGQHSTVSQLGEGVTAGASTSRPWESDIYLIVNTATTIHQEHVPRIKIIPLLDNRYDAFD